MKVTLIVLDYGLLSLGDNGSRRLRLRSVLLLRLLLILLLLMARLRYLSNIWRRILLRMCSGLVGRTLKSLRRISTLGNLRLIFRVLVLLNRCRDLLRLLRRWLRLMKLYGYYLRRQHRCRFTLSTPPYGLLLEVRRLIGR